MRKTLTIVPLLVFLLAGCASMGLQSGPDLTIGERLALVDREFTAVVNTASDLAEAGILDEEDRTELDPVIQEGNRALDRAWTAYNTGKTAKAQEELSVSTEMLLQLRSMIQEAQNDE